MRNPSASASTTSKTTPCCSKVGLKRGPWTPEEDELLSNYIRKEGEGRWRTLPKKAGLLRCGKSCRLRWMNYLRPSVKRGQIAADEEDLILRLHRLLGNRWSLIAGRIPGRTDNEIKNYWNTHLSKKLISQGIDPRTHKPLKQSSNSAAAADDHGTKASSSSRKHRVSSPIPNNNPSPSSGLEEIISGSTQIIGENGYREESTNLINNHYGYNNITGSAAEIGNGEDHDNINYCTEDVFSSFLNSLINEDVFVNSQNQHQLQQIHQPNGMIITPTVSDANFCFGITGGVWPDSSLLPSSENPDIHDSESCIFSYKTMRHCEVSLSSLRSQEDDGKMMK